MSVVYIGVGSNLGDREAHLEFARQELSASVHVKNLKCSTVRETDPVEVAGGKFLNAVWSFQTDLVSEDLLDLLLSIEIRAGRVRARKNDARPLDLDILLYDDVIIRTAKLTVPHPKMHERYFVLSPLCDLAPDLLHPVFKKTAKELLTSIGHGAKRLGERRERWQSLGSKI